MKAIIIYPLFVMVGLAAGAGAQIYLAKDKDAAEAGTPEKPAAYAGPVEFAKLPKQFIVPVIEDSGAEAMVVLSLSLEVHEGHRSNVFKYEPRLRSELLQTLFDHASYGGFSGDFTSLSKMTSLQRLLKESSEQVLGKVVSSVLITDIVRQTTRS